MSFTKKTIRDVDLAGKQVLLRTDYNVPLDKNGVITSDYRIKMSLPTIKALKEAGCKIVICSHLGRPSEKGDPKTTLKLVAKRLGELLGEDVVFVSD